MSNNNTTPVSFDALAVGRSSTNAFITVFQTRNPNSNDVNYPIQQRWYNTTLESEWILTAYSIVSEVKTAVWQPISEFAATAETLTGNSGGAVGVDGSNNINVIGDGTTINVVGNPGTHTLTISAIGSGIVETLTGNSGGAISPSSGNINTVGTGSITVVGSGNTLTTELTGLTNHAVLVGAGTATITNLGVGVTGAVLAGNTGADPSFQTLGALSIFTSVNIQTFATNGTYTPTAGMLYCIIECVGGGGGGGGAVMTGAGSVSCGGGGGGGEYTRGLFTAANIGASKSVTIGAGGTGVSGTAGNNGGTTSIGSTLISAIGGTGGAVSVAGTTAIFGSAGQGGTGGTGAILSIHGSIGQIGNATTGGGFSLGGSGGASFLGIDTGAGSAVGVGQFAGGNAIGYGTGGGGAANGASQAAIAGGNGFAGLVIITEFI